MLDPLQLPPGVKPHMLGQTKPPDIQINVMEPSNNNPVNGLYLDSSYDPATHRLSLIRVGGMDILLHIAVELLKNYHDSEGDELVLSDPKCEEFEEIIDNAFLVADAIIQGYRRHMRHKQKPA